MADTPDEGTRGSENPWLVAGTNLSGCLPLPFGLLLILPLLTVAIIRWVIRPNRTHLPRPDDPNDAS